MEIIQPAENSIMGFQDEYRFLSNFWEAAVTVTGIPYKNTEAAYQAAKTTDMNIRAQFSDLNAHDAKRMGKKIELRPDWDIIKIEVMELVLRAKFMTHPGLAARLIATGDRHLYEFNTWGDTTWGIVRRATGQLYGQNLLGKLLMNIREDLINGAHDGNR